MSSIPISVATASDLGCIAALRQLANRPTSSSSLSTSNEAKAIIIGFFEHQHISKGKWPTLEALAGSALLPPHALEWDGALSRLEQEVHKEGLTQFEYEFIEARHDLGLPPSMLFPLRPFVVPARLEKSAAAWNALLTATNPTDAALVLDVYVGAKIMKGRSSADISSSLDKLEKKVLDGNIRRISNAFIAFRATHSLPPSHLLTGSSATRVIRTPTSKGLFSSPISFSESKDPAVVAEAAYQFLSRRAVDGFVESQSEVLSALASEKTKREDGRALLLLHGFCDHNKRNRYDVRERLDRLEKEMLARKLTRFAPELHQTRTFFGLPPSHIIPLSSPSPVSPPPSSAPLPLPVEPPAFQDNSELPAYVR